jgi:peroxiredoxin
VIIYCVNDGAVMDAWEMDQGAMTSSMVNFFGDPYSQLTEALDMKLVHPGPEGVGLINRCKRNAMYLEDGRCTQSLQHCTWLCMSTTSLTCTMFVAVFGMQELRKCAC